MTASKSILGLDVGGSRVGLALANPIARLASPLCTLRTGDDFWSELDAVIKSEDIGILVVGLPRNLSGEATSQTASTEDFINELKQRFDMSVYTQDEAVTSRQAEAELQARGKSFKREDIDALAATYILEDWLNANTESTDD